MAWSLPPDAVLLSLVTALLAWVLIGVYAYREATREDRSSPRFRGAAWWALGLAGALAYLLHVRKRETSKLVWIGLAAVLVAVWAVEPLVQREPPGIRAWAAFGSGMLVLYWQFYLRADGSG